VRALSIRQPYAELILRGIKTVELRSISTAIIGERFYIYASKSKATPPKLIWSDDLRADAPPAWMIELAQQVKMIEPELLTAGLPTGVIVGSAVIERVSRVESIPSINNQQSTVFRWHLINVERAKTLRKPMRQPQPVWFRPF
jgi:predicted transcriptional regulator